MSTELVEIEPVSSGNLNLWQAHKPTEVIARATETSKALVDVVRKQRLTVAISGREHPKVEAWTLLGSMMGVFPICTWTRKLDDGWEARVEARTLAGQVVGAAEAQCLRSESLWSKRDDYALRSMAQTRATSKALRQPLGFVMVLAGFDATPYEEIPVDEGASPFQPPAAAGGQQASEPHMKNVHRLLKKIADAGGISAADLDARLAAKYGDGWLTTLSKKDATVVIDGLKKLAGEETL